MRDRGHETAPPALAVPRQFQLEILQADSVPTELRDRHGNYPDMFRRLLAAAGLPEAQVAATNVPADGVPSAITADAYLITGSRFSVYDDEAWIRELAEFVQTVFDSRRPVVGICFGHQLLAHFFGGAVAKAAVGWRVGVHEADVLQRRDWMSPYQAQFALLSMHQDQVVRLPPGATCLASSPGCPVAAFELGRQALAIQGHPEFEKAYEAELLELRRERMGEQTFVDGQASLASPTTADVVAGWMLNFLLAGQLRETTPPAVTEVGSEEVRRR